MEENKSIFYWISFVLMLAIVLAQYLISYEINNVLNYIFLCWLVLSVFLLKNSGEFRYKYWCLLLFSLFYFLSLLSCIGPDLAFKKLIVFLFSISPIIMYDIYKDCGRKVQFVFIVIMTIAIIANGIYLYSITLISGDLGLKVIHDDNLVFKNSFNVVYSFALLLPSLFFLFFRYLLPNNKMKVKLFVTLLLLILTLSCLYLVLASYYMTAILVALLSCLMVFIYGKPNWIFKTIVVVALFVLLFNVSYNLIIEYANQTGMSSVLTLRLDELHNTLTGNNSLNSDITSRQDLTQSSFMVFLQNPILGVLHRSANFEAASDYGIGQHSEWFDMLGMYGIFAFAIFWFLYKSMKSVYRDMGTYFIFIPYVLIGFLNPVFSFAQNFIVFLFLPMLFTYFKDEQYE